MVASFFLVMIVSMGDLDDVSVVELVLEGDDLPHEAQSTELVVKNKKIEEQLQLTPNNPENPT